MRRLQIKTKNIVKEISPDLYGIFFEDINYGADGGLYGELVANNSFEYFDRDEITDKRKMCWEPLGDVVFDILSIEPLNSTHTNYARISGSKGAGIRNLGFCREGVAIKRGSRYNFSVYARAEAETELEIVISDREAIYAKGNITISSKEWKKYELAMIGEADCREAFLEIRLAEGGMAELEFVSFFPENVTSYGLRQDMMDMLRELKLKFMRFPGGCIVEGRSYANMYQWKDTIGPREGRRLDWNRWQMEEYQWLGGNSEDYFQSFGLGYYEYFLLCEDIGAKPLPVMNVGMTCQWHEGLLVELDRLDAWIQDILDLIEFANGDESTVWGKKRIELGHREPFNLEYIGIGNEQWGMEYFERYEIFADRINKVYPDIKLITSAGWTAEGEHFDLAYKWMSENKDKAYAVDEHFYKSPEWFLENVNRYDNYDRSLPKVFAGEYAAHTSDRVEERKNNFYAALCEAAFLTGVEKNADHVVMACYAPLFARTGHNQWQPDLIWFDKTSVYGTPSYYVQKLFSNNYGDKLVEVQTEENKGLCVSATMEENKLYVKVVNVTAQDECFVFDIDRAVKSCVITTLCAAPEAVNSHDKPENVYPISSAQEGISESYICRGNSIIVFELDLN